MTTSTQTVSRKPRSANVPDITPYWQCEVRALLKQFTQERRSPVLRGAHLSPVTLLTASASQWPANASNEFSGRRIHFMGAGGIGVSALMELAAARGAIVSGCDCSPGGQVESLRAKGIHIEVGHCSSHVGGCDELVHTAAVSETHPEVQQAIRDGKIINSRMRTLGRIARSMKSVCVTGAHGKTTTTWLISNLLIAGGLDPSVLVGGVVKELGGNVRVGHGELFVAEVDESDNRLHEVLPTIPVLTNIDNDHLDHYGTIEAIETAALRFMCSMRSNDTRALLVGCGDDTRVMRVLEQARAHTRRQFISYGFTQHCLLRALNVRPEAVGSRFDVLGPFGLWSEMTLPMPGEHNVLNALAAIAVGWHLGIPESVIRAALAQTQRVGRRFEIKGVKNGIRVIDDYGHHPTEIEATLRAARQSTLRRLGVLFQPHRFTRTAALMDQFAGCFSSADALFLLPIYAASEKPLPGIDHHALAEAIRRRLNISVQTAENREEAVSRIAQWAGAGDTLVTQGAGDVTRAADELVSRL